MVRDTAITAGATFGRDSGDEIGMPRVRVGGFAGIRTRYAGLEAGAEVGRLHSERIVEEPGPSDVRETHLQTYLNATATLTPGQGLFPRLYLLASARRYSTSVWLADAERYGFDPHESSEHGVMLHGGAGVAYGPVSIEALTPLTYDRNRLRSYPSATLRARISVPVFQLGGR